MAAPFALLAMVVTYSAVAMSRAELVGDAITASFRVPTGTLQPRRRPPVGNESPTIGTHATAAAAADTPANFAVHHPGSLTTPDAESRNTSHPDTTSGFQLPTSSRTADASTGDVNLAITSEQANQGGPSCQTRT